MLAPEGKKMLGAPIERSGWYQERPSDSHLLKPVQAAEASKPDPKEQVAAAERSRENGRTTNTGLCGGTMGLEKAFRTLAVDAGGWMACQNVPEEKGKM